MKNIKILILFAMLFAINTNQVFGSPAPNTPSNPRLISIDNRSQYSATSQNTRNVVGDGLTKRTYHRVTSLLKKLLGTCCEDENSGKVYVTDLTEAPESLQTIKSVSESKAIDSVKSEETFKAGTNAQFSADSPGFEVVDLAATEENQKFTVQSQVEKFTTLGQPLLSNLQLQNVEITGVGLANTQAGQEPTKQSNQPILPNLQLKSNEVVLVTEETRAKLCRKFLNAVLRPFQQQADKRLVRVKANEQCCTQDCAEMERFVVEKACLGLREITKLLLVQTYKEDAKLLLPSNSSWLIELEDAVTKLCQHFGITEQQIEDKAQTFGCHKDAARAYLLLYSIESNILDLQPRITKVAKKIILVGSQLIEQERSEIHKIFSFDPCVVNRREINEIFNNSIDLILSAALKTYENIESLENKITQLELQKEDILNKFVKTGLLIKPEITEESVNAILNMQSEQQQKQALRNVVEFDFESEVYKGLCAEECMNSNNHESAQAELKQAQDNLEFLIGDGLSSIIKLLRERIILDHFIRVIIIEGFRVVTANEMSKDGFDKFLIREDFSYMLYFMIKLYDYDDLSKYGTPSMYFFRKFIPIMREAMLSAEEPSKLMLATPLIRLPATTRIERLKLQLFGTTIMPQNKLFLETQAKGRLDNIAGCQRVKDLKQDLSSLLALIYTMLQ